MLKQLWQKSLASIRSVADRWREHQNETKPAPYWPDELLEFDAPLIAGELIPLILLWRQWVHRRVESIEFLDDRRIRRQISVDFTLPETISRPFLSLGNGEHVPVPLALMTKRLLLDFDVWDESDHNLPTMGRVQNTVLARHILANLAEQALGDDMLPDPLRDEVMAIAESSVRSAREVLQRFAAGPTYPSQRALILESPAFRTLAVDFARNFLLLVPCDVDVGHRRIIKFAYDEELEFGGHGWFTKLWVRLGILPYRLSVAFNSLARAESYHIASSPPEGLFIDDACLWLEGPDARLELSSSRPLHQAHFHLTGGHPQIARESVATLEVAFNIHPSGLLTALLLNSFITSCLLLGGILLNLLAGTAPSATSSVSAVLLVIPAIFAAYVFRPGEHELARRMFIGLRVEAAFIMLAAFWAAATLAVDPPHAVRYWGWVLATFLAVSATLLVGLAFLLAKIRVERNREALLVQ